VVSPIVLKLVLIVPVEVDVIVVSSTLVVVMASELEDSIELIKSIEFKDSGMLNDKLEVT